MSRQDPSPYEQELAGLPELEQFASDEDRAAALRAVHHRIENPNTLSYWLWVAMMVAAALGVARLVVWGLAAAGAPRPFPAVLGLVAGIAAYFLISRIVIRFAARPELRRELASRSAVPDDRPR